MVKKLDDVFLLDRSDRKAFANANASMSALSGYYAEDKVFFDQIRLSDIDRALRSTQPFTRNF